MAGSSGRSARIDGGGYQVGFGSLRTTLVAPSGVLLPKTLRPSG